jgi:hypothetical protein
MISKLLNMIALRNKEVMMSNRRYFYFILIVTLFLFCQKNKSITSTEDVGELISFKSFLQSDVFFLSSSTELIVLRNKADEQEFLRTIRTSGSEFPEFSYTDSLLVGMILGSEPDSGSPPASSDSFSIDSLKAFSDYIAVYSHLFLPKIRTGDIVSPCHFIAIEKTDKKFRMKEVVYIHEDPY